jgi:23S rRNA (adenine-C8)-methyltransferase
MSVTATTVDRSHVPRLETLQALVSAHNEPNYRYRQITSAVFTRHVKRYSEITAVPLPLRQALSNQLGEDILTLKPVEQQASAQATKVLFELHDGHRIEAVRMRYLRGQTALCISSQAGCALGCVFCSTGAIGFKRNLTADEIVDQVLYFQQQGHHIKSISFMGMGEALLNPSTFEALRLLTDKNYFNLGQRRLSVSTVGIIPGIERLSIQFPQVNLAFSLHSPFDDQRSALVPLNKTYPLDQIMPVLDDHIRRTHRKVFVAYLILNGYNDTPEHAEALSTLVGKRGNLSHLYHVNLLRYNWAQGTPKDFHTSEQHVRRFKQMLEAAGLSVTARQSFGVDIDAACGQLYGRYEQRRKSKII